MKNTNQSIKKTILIDDPWSVQNTVFNVIAVQYVMDSDLNVLTVWHYWLPSSHPYFRIYKL